MSGNLFIFFLNAKKPASSFTRFAGVVERGIHLTRAKLPFLFSRALRFTQSLLNFPQSWLIAFRKPGGKLVYRMTLENDCGECFIRVKNNSATYNCYISILIIQAFSNCNFGYGLVVFRPICSCLQFANTTTIMSPENVTSRFCNYFSNIPSRLTYKTFHNYPRIKLERAAQG